jgi:hypothetical protein
MCAARLFFSSYYETASKRLIATDAYKTNHCHIFIVMKRRNLTNFFLIKESVNAQLFLNGHCLLPLSNN